LESLKSLLKEIQQNYRVDNIIGDPRRGVSTRSKVKDYVAMISQMEPKNINEGLEDESLVNAMKEELD